MAKNVLDIATGIKLTLDDTYEDLIWLVYERPEQETLKEAGNSIAAAMEALELFISHES